MIRLYRTENMLGGVMLGHEVGLPRPLLRSAISGVRIHSVTCGGNIEAVSADALRFNGGQPRPVMPGQSRILVAADGVNNATVRRMTSAPLGGTAIFDAVPVLNGGLFGGAHIYESREEIYQTRYLHTCAAVMNHGDAKARITAIADAKPLKKIYVRQDFTLPHQGDLEIDLSEFEIHSDGADWPNVGFCLIGSQADETLDYAYYTMDEPGILFIDGNARGLFGFAPLTEIEGDIYIRWASGYMLGFEPAYTGQVYKLNDPESDPPMIFHFRESWMLLPGEWAGLWLKRVLPYGQGETPEFRRFLTIENESSGHEHVFSGANTICIGRDDLYVLVDFTNAPEIAVLAGSATLPFEYEFPAPDEPTRFRMLVWRFSPYGLVSHNRWPQWSGVIDQNGQHIPDPLPPPQDVVLSSVQGGRVRVLARYSDIADDPPDEWLIWYSNDPMADPDVIVPFAQDLGAGVGFGVSPNIMLNHVIGPFEINTRLNVLVRVRRSHDGAMSNNDEPVSFVVNTARPHLLSAPIAFHGSNRYSGDAGIHYDPASFIEEEYGHGFSTKRGPCWIFQKFFEYADIRILTAAPTATGLCIRVWPGWKFRQDMTVLAPAESDDPVEVVSPTLAYFTAGWGAHRKRLLRVDFAAYILSAPSFRFYPAQELTQPVDHRVAVPLPNGGEMLRWNFWDLQAGAFRPVLEMHVSDADAYVGFYGNIFTEMGRPV